MVLVQLLPPRNKANMDRHVVLSELGPRTSEGGISRSRKPGLEADDPGSASDPAGTLGKGKAHRSGPFYGTTASGAVQWDGPQGASGLAGRHRPSARVARICEHACRPPAQLRLRTQGPAEHPGRGPGAARPARPQPSALSPEPSALGPQPSALGPRP